MPQMNPWNPLVNSAVDLKHLGKLAEELGELTAIVSRCIIQGVEASEPRTGYLNRAALQDEIADVTAGISLLAEHLLLDHGVMTNRVNRKKKQLREWHAMTGEPDNGR